jgi:hypothetical protein
MKKTLKSRRQDNLVQDTKDNNIDIENIIITTPSHLSMYEPEKRTARIQSMITQSEKDELLNQMGRFKESDVLREMVLLTLGKPTTKVPVRNLILKLIHKNNER